MVAAKPQFQLTLMMLYRCKRNKKKNSSSKRNEHLATLLV